MEIRDLTKVVGMVCTYNFTDDLSVWDNETTIKAKVIDVYLEKLDKFPYTLDVVFRLKPLDNNQSLSDEVLEDMDWGVSIDSVILD